MQGNCGGFERPKEKLISDVSIAGKGILLIAYSKRHMKLLPYSAEHLIFRDHTRRRL